MKANVEEKQGKSKYFVNGNLRNRDKVGSIGIKPMLLKLLPQKVT